MDYGPLALGIAAIITALGGFVIQLLLLRRTEQIHTIVNSKSDRANEDLIRSNNMLSTVLAQLSEERKASVDATLAASLATIERLTGELKAKNSE